MNARRCFGRRVRWGTIVFTAAICILLLLLIVFPVRFISADKMSRAESQGILLVDSSVVLMPELSEPPPLDLSGLSSSEQKDQYKEMKEMYLHSVSKFTQKIIQIHADKYVVDQVQSLGTGMYIVDLSSGRYLIMVVGKKVVLKAKIG